MPAQFLMSNRYIIIMAGGRGERFWPKSRLARPKHSQPIVGDKTMLAQTVERVAALVPAENLIVITNTEQRAIILEDLPALTPAQVVGEPVGRDTAAVVGLATVLVKAKDPDATYAILPADHVIHDGAAYRTVLDRAFTAAEETSSLVTIGIKPTEPATGYGYIHVGDARLDVGGFLGYDVQRFIEKPTLETAQGYLDSGEYFWNAGMFIWKASVIDEVLKLHTPVLYEGLQKISSGIEAGELVEDLMETVNADFESAVAKGDSALARRLASASARLEHFDSHFHTWNETVVAMPGESCSHEDHDHDHGDHDHHHVTTLPDGLSDEDMLEIQATIMEALEALNREFELIQSASGPVPATDAEPEGALE